MSLSDWSTTWALQALGAVARTLPWSGRRTLGRLIGRRMMGLSSSRRRITEENVERAFPSIAAPERDAIVHASYENLGVVLTELLATPTLTREAVLDRVSIPGFDAVRARHAEGKPTIFLSAHYGNWEYLAMAAGLMLDAPVSIVVHPQHNAAADRILNAYRSQFGNILVPMGDAARPLVRTLSTGGTVAFLVDQHGVPEKDPWIEFFGVAAPTYEAPAALALRFNAPIFYAFAERMEDGRYVAQIRELPMDDLTNDRDGVRELTRRHVAVLEEQLRRRPELWSWQHRRWRA